MATDWGTLQRAICSPFKDQFKRLVHFAINKDIDQDSNKVKFKKEIDIYDPKSKEVIEQ